MSRSIKAFIFASDIAAFIGQNHYDYVSCFERLWKKCDPDYDNIIDRINKENNEKKRNIVQLNENKKELQKDLDNKKITKSNYTIKLKNIEQEEKIIIESIEKVQENVDNIVLTQREKLEKVVGKDFIDKVESKTLETNEKKSQASDLIEHIDMKDKIKIKNEMVSFINKTHGTLKEDDAIKMYEKKFKVKLDTTQVFHKKEIKLSNVFKWYIGGKVDGLYIDQNDNNNSYLVEVKNRTKSFFNVLRDYEKTQIQMYLYMLNMETAKLVEKYNNKIRITIVYKDQQYINDTLEYLNIFITNFENKFINDFEAKMYFVNNERSVKEQFIKKMYLNEINIRFNEKLNINKSTEEFLLDDLDDC